MQTAEGRPCIGTPGRPQSYRIKSTAVDVPRVLCLKSTVDFHHDFTVAPNAVGSVETSGDPFQRRAHHPSCRSRQSLQRLNELKSSQKEATEKVGLEAMQLLDWWADCVGNSGGSTSWFSRGSSGNDKSSTSSVVCQRGRLDQIHWGKSLHQLVQVCEPLFSLATER